MRKIILILFALIVSFTAIGCTGGNGCSCTQEDPVSYYVKWTGSEDALTDYKEVATYKVAYKDNFNENDFNYKKVDEIGCKMDVSKDSKYVVTTEIVKKEAIPANAKVDSGYKGKYYKITTNLSVIPTYTIGSTVETCYDSVYSEVYFYDETYGFAPIYSIKNYDTSNISLNTDGYAEKIIKYVYSTETIYDGGDITFKVIQDASTLPESEGIVSFPTINTHDGYDIKGDFKNFIDNETLLFACRNISLKDGESLKVVSPSYLNVEKINVSKVTESNTYLTISVNGTSDEATIPTTRLAVLRAAENNTGSAIIVDVQRSSFDLGGTEYNNAFMAKMITRLPSHIGALVYELDTVQITPAK